ncbi:hypothetical protein [Agrococcus sp. ARC_14]|uniref:hypothetical protein n=1 Tax=Agrococcus sp. ARC_14 TaxID=2919927 RepID=UPI001F06109B|nr:hypothetical protein [Agrococcus sp. ARC_14]MCH1883406.1 hypothetical protein [Agrococcus sp. ARC_14]
MTTAPAKPKGILRTVVLALLALVAIALVVWFGTRLLRVVVADPSAASVTRVDAAAAHVTALGDSR